MYPKVTIHNYLTWRGVINKKRRKLIHEMLIENEFSTIKNVSQWKLILERGQTSKKIYLNSIY